MIQKKLINCNHNIGRKLPISEITIHHTGGVLKSADSPFSWFNNPTVKASAHYCILDNSICQFVEEENTAWTNSNSSANARAITIEVVNSKGGPNWEVSDESLDTLLKLITIIGDKYKLWPLISGENLTWHSMYSNTICPGYFLQSKIKALAFEADNYGGPLYFVRDSTGSRKTQIGAFNMLTLAKKLADENGFKVFDIFEREVNY